MPLEASQSTSLSLAHLICHVVVEVLCWELRPRSGSVPGTGWLWGNGPVAVVVLMVILGVPVIKGSCPGLSPVWSQSGWVGHSCLGLFLWPTRDVTVSWAETSALESGPATEGKLACSKSPSTRPACPGGGHGEVAGGRASPAF